MKKPTMKTQPISQVRWVSPDTLTANDYNPNKVFPIELELLKLSILEDGWTQPIVVRPSMEIIDGFHRWTLGSHDPEISSLTNGLVPIVVVNQTDPAKLMASTVRHNRARGQHGVLKMAAIVRAAVDEGMTQEQVCEHFGMEKEEFVRLYDFRSSPQRTGQDSFGKGWIPTK